MFAIVDIETCGSKFAYQRGRIIDICILVHDGISVVDKFSTLINPECFISGFYTNISGITNEMVKDAPKFHEVAKDILSFTDGKVFVAHNSAFDYNFIKDEFASIGYRYKRDTLCTVKLSRKLMPGKKSYSLGNLCASIGIEIVNRHRAEGDALATAKLLDVLFQLKTQSPIYKSKSVSQIMSTRIDAIKKYILDKVPAVCGVYYFRNKASDIIYIGKSIDMYARALSHFNADLKKSKAMLNDLYNADWIETGSELIALLLESQEIKKYKPVYNRQRKQDTFTHGIKMWYNNDHIINFAIEPFNKDEHFLVSFTNYTSARETIERWINEHELCLRYCNLTSDESVCFHHQIKKCRGICAQQELAVEYNKRAQIIVQANSFHHKNFLIVDKGKHHEEHSFILIENFRLKGYGYFDESQSLTNLDEANEYLTQRTLHPDEDEIVKSWLKQKKVRKVVFNDNH
jgi:DNA polymerase III subunit epsilon